MSEWYNSQKKPSSNFWKLLQEQIAKANPRRTLTAEEHRRLSKIEAIAAKLKRGENVLSESCKNQYNAYIEKNRCNIHTITN